ncbi:Laccase-25 [Dichanthelium oligosanthes]|uniref:Laccase n=1 Tax=Dichanthelium oligosanthes TaxID=888268 RepID=A0A1E5W819_9POAL|nr:Laccase-25 [Dichanthelium oligosanthes]
MARCCWLQWLTLALVACCGHAATVEHTFDVGNFSISQLCKPARVITAVNSQLPGPTIYVHEGDTVVVHVINNSPYNITIHWHGLFQRGTQWADGPEMVTQCPIRPGTRYTYQYNATGQEGTLWWHAHSSMLRATVHGAVVIKPRNGDQGYPFPKPDKEEIILLGEWWNRNVFDLEREAFLTGLLVDPADAYTINGKPGDLHKCSGSNRKPATFKLKVQSNSTYLLRIINAAVNTPMFFKIAGHKFTVVGADASYTTPYKTGVVVVAPGQTVDALMVADARPSRRYYMVASPYNSAHPNLPFREGTATAVVEYAGARRRARRPLLPPMPKFSDTATAHRFFTSLTALIRPGQPTVPLAVDTRMFVTIGLGFADCRPEQTRCKQQVFAGSMNNASFVLPTTMSLLEAHFRNVAGVYTRDFPDRPPLEFNYAKPPGNMDATTAKSTKVKTVRYNATVEVVLQNTVLVARESHPMHLHGHNFFVLAQGFGNFHEDTAVKRYNLVNPQERNTLAVPPGGWAVIRFVANNPGMWIMHCHFDAHLPIGLAMAFEVQDGPTPETALPPPPADLPQC